MPAASLPLNAEWSVLLAACSVDCSPDCSGAPGAQKLSRLRTLLEQPVDWKSLSALASRNGVQPLLYQALLRVAAAVPAAEMQSLKQAYHTNLQKALLLSREFIRILDQLSRLGLEVMPYKGLALAEVVYGDITLRQSGDIDLLIRAEDLPQVRKAVGELGYVPHVPLSEEQEQVYLNSGYECAFDGAAGRNLLEVQWAIQPRFYAIDFDMPGIFRRAISVDVAGQSVKTPSQEDLLLILSAHAAKHVWERLVWLCDIARLLQLPDLNWDWIGSQAKALGVCRILQVTMLAANRLVEAPLPAAAAKSFPQDSAASDLADEIIGYVVSEADYNVESLPYFRLMMRLRERASDRRRFLRRLIFTPGPSEWQAVRLPRPLYPLYRLVRLSRLAARLVRA
jgi:hypothetical protein